MGSLLPVQPSVLVRFTDGTPAESIEVQFSGWHGTSSIITKSEFTNQSGIATASGWTLGFRAGLDTVQVLLTGAVPDHVAGTPTFFTATGTAGPPTRLFRFSPDGQIAPTGAAVDSAPTVRVADAYGNPVAGKSVRFVVDTGGGSVVDTAAVSDSNGLATAAKWVLGPAVGRQHVTAIFQPDSGPPVLYGFSATAIYASSAMTIASGNGQVLPFGEWTQTPVAVAIRTPAGAPVAGTRVVFTATTDAFFDAGRSIKIDTITTGADGTASVTVWPLSIGPHTILATSPGYQVDTFTIVHASPPRGIHCGLTATGDAYCWGDNVDGEVGNGTTDFIYGPTAVVGGITFASLSTGTGDHTCGITPQGQAYCWGYNAFGELGDGTTTSRTRPTAVSGAMTFRTIAVGEAQTCALTIPGEIYCWGWAGHTGLGGAPPGMPVPTPQHIASAAAPFVSVAVGRDDACAIGRDGRIYCWGWGRRGELGDGTVAVPHANPAPIADSHAYVAVTAGKEEACGVTIAAAAYCWGGPFPGDGVNHNVATPIPVAGNIAFASISASNGACGTATDGRLYCWGYNANGELGNGLSGGSAASPALVSGDLRATTVDLHWQDACASSVTGQPYCWGNNFYGAVGLSPGRYSNSLVPVAVSVLARDAGVAASMSPTTARNQTTTAGTAPAEAATVRVVDSGGNPVAGVTVHFQVVAGGGTIGQSSVVTDAGGIASSGTWTLGSSAGYNAVIASVDAVGTVTFTATGQ